MALLIALKEEGCWTWNEEDEEPMSSFMMTSSTSSEEAATGSSSSENPLECSISVFDEATRFTTEIEMLTEQLVLAEERIAEERKQRLEAEEKFKKLKSSMKSVNEEYSQFFEDVKQHEDEGLRSNSSWKARLDKMSKSMGERLEKHVKEQISLKATVKEMNQIIQNLMKIIISKPLTNPSTAPQAHLKASIGYQSSSSTKHLALHPKLPNPRPPVTVSMSSETQAQTTMLISNESVSMSMPSTTPLVKSIAMQKIQPKLKILSRQPIKPAAKPATSKVPSLAVLWKHRKYEHSKVASDPSKLRNQKSQISSKVSKKPVLISRKKHALNITKRHQGFHCICGFNCITRKSLDGHIQRQNKHDIKSTSPSPPATGKKWFGCVICDGAFSRIYDLHRHLKTIHSADPLNFPMQCPICGVIFRSGQRLKRHRLAVHERKIKNEAKRRSKLAASSESSVPITIVDLDDDDGDYGSSPLLLEPVPILIDIDGSGEDQEMLAISKSVVSVSVAASVQITDEQEGEDDLTRDPPSSPLDTHFMNRVNGESWSTKCGTNDKAREKLFRHNEKFRFYKMFTPRSNQKDVHTNTSPSHHQQISSRSSDKYLCSCGSNYGEKSSLLKHIDEKLRGN